MLSIKKFYNLGPRDANRKPEKLFLFVKKNAKNGDAAKQRIHMKYQALFSSKDQVKKIIKCRLLQFLFGGLRVRLNTT